MIVMCPICNKEVPEEKLRYSLYHGNEVCRDCFDQTPDIKTEMME